MRKLIFLLLAVVLAATTTAQPVAWFLHYSTPFPGGTTGRCVDLTPDSAIWAGGGANHYLVDRNTGAIYETLPTGGSVRGTGYNPSNNQVYSLNISGANRLRGREAAPPYTQTLYGTPVTAGRHICFLADGGRILVDGTASWKRYSAAGTLIQVDSSGVAPSSPNGVAIDEVGNRFWMSDLATTGKVYEFSLSTGGLVATYSVSGVSGLAYSGGTLYGIKTTGALVDAMTGTPAFAGFSGPSGAQDLWISNGLLVIVSTSAVWIYRPYPPSPLPVELVSFEARLLDETTAVLTAVTATERDNVWMILEHSLNGLTFEEADRLPGAGTTTQKQTYRFEKAVEPGIHYWRLRQVDADEQYTFSPVQVLKVEGIIQTLAVWPNPAAVGSPISFAPPNGWDVVEISTLYGQQVMRVEEGQPAPTLPVGQYVVRVSGQTNAKPVKLIVTQ